MEREDYHIDLSGRFYEKGATGIACVNTGKSKHCGLAIKGRDKNIIKRKLFSADFKEEYARLYSICIYFLIKDKLSEIKNLVVCNDECFLYVKEYLNLLIREIPNKIKIISITELKEKLGKNVKSLADNFAKHYRKRALKPNKWNNGKRLNVCKITTDMIIEKWEEIDKKLNRM